MKCLILAAGYATRLYPLTENFPKPLLPLGEKTILDWLLDDISTAKAVDEYVVISNSKFSEHFRNWAATRSLPITVVDDGTDTNETRLGAVCDMQFAIDALGIDVGVANYQINSRGEGFMILSETLNSEQYAVGFKKGNQTLADIVTKDLKKLTENGTVAALAEKYDISDLISLTSD